MPQEFHVVRCYKCETFQVQIVKKVPKWECKICGEKQSVRKVYGKGASRDCRNHVQKLNALRVETTESDNILSVNEIENTLNKTSRENCLTINTAQKNKWYEFLDESELKNEDKDNIKDNENINILQIRKNDSFDNVSESTSKKAKTFHFDDHLKNNSEKIPESNFKTSIFDESENIDINFDL